MKRFHCKVLHSSFTLFRFLFLKNLKELQNGSRFDLYFLKKSSKLTIEGPLKDNQGLTL